MSTTVSHPLPSAQAHAIADLTGYEDAATLRWQQACVQAANTLTALPNGRYVTVRMERMRQGLELAQGGAVTLPDDGQDLSAVVRSGSHLYQVDTRLLTCTCADHIPLNLVVAPQASHKTLDLSIRSPHDVSSAPMAICMEMRHGTDCQTETRKPHHHHRFPR